MNGFRTVILSGICLLTACVASGGNPLPPVPPSSGEPSTVGGSIADGAYTLEQARSGETHFDQACSVCHRPQEFANRIFEIRWGDGRPLDELYSYVRSTMPYDDPGRLTDQQYVDILAYIVELNGHPPGENALPADPAVLGGLALE